MRNYWSCSKLADAIRGTIKPKSLEMGKWDEWTTAAKKNAPIRYWIAEEGLDKVQDFLRSPYEFAYSIKYWLNNRFVTKTHALTSTLKKGQWHEFEERMLYCLFDELVNFIEVEKAAHHVGWDKEAAAKYGTPWAPWRLGRNRKWRSPIAGLNYLEWEMKLNHDWLPDDHPDRYKLTQQAISAKEQFELYAWWLGRKDRKDDFIYKESGWEAFNEEVKDPTGNNWLGHRKLTEEENIRQKFILDTMNQMEIQLAKEDEDMMIRLIKVRHALWT